MALSRDPLVDQPWQTPPGQSQSCRRGRGHLCVLPVPVSSYTNIYHFLSLHVLKAASCNVQQSRSAAPVHALHQLLYLSCAGKLLTDTCLLQSNCLKLCLTVTCTKGILRGALSGRHKNKNAMVSATNFMMRKW